MAAEIYSHGFSKEVLTPQVANLAQSQHEQAIDFLRTIQAASDLSGPEKQKLLDIKSDWLPTYERVFRDSPEAIVSSLLLVNELFSNDSFELSEDIIKPHLDRISNIQVKSPKDAKAIDAQTDNIARLYALLNIGIASLNPGFGGFGAQSGGEEGGSGALFNTFEYAEKIKKTVKEQLRNASQLSDAELGSRTYEDAKMRTNALVASLLLSGDRSDMQFLWNMKMGDKTIGTIVGDWLRELPEAQKRVEDTYTAMSQQMSMDSKRAEEVTRSGIKDTDMLRMLALKFPVEVKVRGVEKPILIEASAWDVVNYLYGNRRVITGKLAVKRENGQVVDRKYLTGLEEIPNGYEDSGVSGPIWTAKEDFISESGRNFERGNLFIVDELSNEDMRRVNNGEVFVYPKLPVDVFAAEEKVPGSKLLTKRADDVARAGSWDYFVDLLGRHGIKIEDVEDFSNPFEEMGIRSGLAADFGSDWLSKLKGFKDRDDAGKILTVRNLAAAMGPIFSAGVTLAKMQGHEYWWNPTYDNSRVTRLIEQTILSHAYDEGKAITPFNFREMILNPTYGTYSDRMTKLHPVMLAWDGKTVDMTDRLDPWENNNLDYKVELKPIEHPDEVRLKDLERQVKEFRRKRKFGIDYDVATYNTTLEDYETVKKTVDEAKRVDEHFMTEKAFLPGIWEERKSVNFVVFNARRKVLSGESTPQEALEWARGILQEDQKVFLWDKKVGRDNFKAMRNVSGIIGSAVGAPVEEKQKIAGRSMSKFIVGSIRDKGNKLRNTSLAENKPEAHKGIMGTMIYASESFGLEMVDYGVGEREIEAWIRYLMYNAETSSLGRQLVSAVVQTHVDSEKLQSAYQRMLTAEDAQHALSHKAGHGAIEFFEKIGLFAPEMSEAEFGALVKELEILPQWVNKHADLSRESRRSLYLSLAYMVEGWLYSGYEHKLLALKDDGSISSKSLPSDKHSPIEFNPNEGSYTNEERELDAGLVELFIENGFRVDFNEKRGSAGRLLLNGGAAAHEMEGYIDEGSGLWKSLRKHDELIAKGKGVESAERPVDVFGMARMASSVVGFHLMKLGTNAELIYAEDVETYAKEAYKWFANKDKSSEIVTK